MAEQIVFCEEFSYWPGTTAADKKHVFSKHGHDSNLIQATVKKSGTHAMKFVNNRGGMWRYLGNTDITEFLFFCWLRVPTDGLPNSREFTICDFRNGYYEQMGLMINSTGTISAYRAGGSQLWTSTETFSEDDDWHCVRFRCLIDDSVGTIDVWVDDTSYISETSVDTKNTSYWGFDGVNEVSIGGPQYGTAEDNLEIYMDEVCIISDPSGDYSGGLRVNRTVPTGDGSDSDWTRVGGGSNQYEAVDDSAKDDDTTYLHSSTATDRELFTFAAMENASSVIGVQTVIEGKRAAPGTRTIKHTSYLSTTQLDGDEKGLPTDDYGQSRYVYMTKPGGGSWSQSDVDNCEFGFLVAS
jgi:hypothetical protein